VAGADQLKEMLPVGGGGAGVLGVGVVGAGVLGVLGVFGVVPPVDCVEAVSAVASVLPPPQALSIAATMTQAVRDILVAVTRSKRDRIQHSKNNCVQRLA